VRYRQLVGDEHSLQPERVAFNEAAFRRGNEIIRDHSKTARFNRIPFLCECGRNDCLQEVELSAAEYESVRAVSTWFFVVPGHEILGSDLAQLVASEDRYAIVEKIGVSAEVTNELDPRAESEERMTG
jgi:hypothetical protein